jgi:hypothetical protein
MDDTRLAAALAELDLEASTLRSRLAAVDAARRRLLPLLMDDATIRGRGQALAAEAVIVLQAADTGLHYREIAQRVRDRGVAIQGVDPEAALLTSISRDPRIGRISRGTYGLTEPC